MRRRAPCRNLYMHSGSAAPSSAFAVRLRAHLAARNRAVSVRGVRPPCAYIGLRVPGLVSGCAGAAACVRVTRGCAVSACLAHALPRCNLFRSLAPVRALPTSVVCDSRSRVSSLCCHALWTLLGCMPCCLLTHLRLLQLCMGSIWRAGWFLWLWPVPARHRSPGLPLVARARCALARCLPLPVSPASPSRRRHSTYVVVLSRRRDVDSAVGSRPAESGERGST